MIPRVPEVRGFLSCRLIAHAPKNRDQLRAGRRTVRLEKTVAHAVHKTAVQTEGDALIGPFAFLRHVIKSIPVIRVKAIKKVKGGFIQDFIVVRHYRNLIELLLRAAKFDALQGIAARERVELDRPDGSRYREIFQRAAAGKNAPRQHCDVSRNTDIFERAAAIKRTLPDLQNRIRQVYGLKSFAIFKRSAREFIQAFRNGVGFQRRAAKNTSAQIFNRFRQIRLFQTRAGFERHAVNTRDILRNLHRLQRLTLEERSLRQRRQPLAERDIRETFTAEKRTSAHFNYRIRNHNRSKLGAGTKALLANALERTR